MFYLIDFENTGDAGLFGIENIKAEDGIIIFFSDASKPISENKQKIFDKLICQKECINVKVGKTNALDFQLVSYLGYLIGLNKIKKFRIISFDTGYDFVVDFWKEKGVDIQRNLNIANQPEINDFEWVGPVFALKIPISTARQLFIHSKDKNELHTKLIKQFGKEKGGQIYEILKNYKK